MLKDITLGQFFPGDSLIHKLDPRVKLILTIVYIAIIFTAKTAASYIAVALFAVCLIAVSRISAVTILKSLKPILFIMVFTAVMNIFWTTGEHVIFSAGPVTVYREGVIFALLMVMRLVMLITGTFVILTYTTSPVALTDAIERLTYPLSKLGVPTHEFAMMMSIALRFIPTLIEETDKIICAQKARGADFETGSLIKRAKALIPILIPLFISSFRRADELAAAMECRLYHGGKGKTRMKVLKLCARDYATILVFATILAVVIVCNMHFEVLI
jgi:energy-coupling factor transport system permease protein